MTQTEQSEFELVLGNKQLLSVFFIVVVLLAVFFFMGYVVGRNSGTAMASNRTPSEVVRPAADRTSPMPSAAQSSPAPAQHPPAEPQTAASEPQTTQPSKAEPAAAAPAVEQPASTPTSVGEPPAGTAWLQVVATTRPDAEVISDTLGKRGFKTQVAPAPNGFFRVLVGPVKGSSEISELRTRLENAGFRNPIVRKY